MRGVVLCEFSGTVSAAFRSVGIECWSCDILPTDGDARWHLQMDAIECAYGMPWDFAVMHPECTFLANSGQKHLYRDGLKANGRESERWASMEKAALFYQRLRDAPIKFKGVENPVMHGAAIQATQRGPVRYYHPHFFGDPFIKLTGFETIGFPPLKRTHHMDVPKPGTARHRAWTAAHRMSPSAKRSLLRARFHHGFARAIANQWGSFLTGGYDL